MEKKVRPFFHSEKNKLFVQQMTLKKDKMRRLEKMALNPLKLSRISLILFLFYETLFHKRLFGCFTKKKCLGHLVIFKGIRPKNSKITINISPNESKICNIP